MLRWGFAAIAAWVALLARAKTATAQVRWDFGAQAGATERVATGAAPDRSLGPSAEIHAHLALYPMIRAGPYAAFDLSPVDGLRARRVYSTGLRVKVTPPIVSSPWRTWGFAGIGVAYAYAPGSMGLRASATTMPEVPIGFGVGLKIRRGCEVYAELGMRWNLAAFGSSVNASRPVAPVEVYVGDDLLAVSLGVGVNLGD